MHVLLSLKHVFGHRPVVGRCQDSGWNLTNSYRGFEGPGCEVPSKIDPVLEGPGLDVLSRALCRRQDEHSDVSILWHAHLMLLVVSRSPHGGPFCAVCRVDTASEDCLDRRGLCVALRAFAQPFCDPLSLAMPRACPLDGKDQLVQRGLEQSFCALGL